MGSDSTERDNSIDSEVGRLSTLQAGGTGRKGSDKSGSRSAGRPGTGSTIDVGETKGTTARAGSGAPKRQTGIRTID
jgi:hypothetical protein